MKPAPAKPERVSHPSPDLPPRRVISLDEIGWVKGHKHHSLTTWEWCLCEPEHVVQPVWGNLL